MNFIGNYFVKSLILLSIMPWFCFYRNWNSLFSLCYQQLNLSTLFLQVFEVEEEMRQLLQETEANKKIMEEKMKRLTSVLKDFNT